MADDPVSVLDTHESRTAISRHVRFEQVLYHDGKGRERVYSGYCFTCPRCAWRSKPMREIIGATHRGEKHALSCPDPNSQSVLLEQLELAVSGAPQGRVV